MNTAILTSVKGRSRKGKGTISQILSVIVLFLTIAMPFTQPSITAEAASGKLNVTEQTLVIGQSVSLKLSGVANSKVKWSSSNSSVASVSKGRVTARKEGSAKISATYNKKRWFCKIYVTAMELSYYDFNRSNDDGGNFVDAYYDSNPEDGVYFVIYSSNANYNRGIECGDSAEDVVAAFGDSYSFTYVSRNTNGYGDEFDEIDGEPVYAITYAYVEIDADDAVSKTFYFDEDDKVVLIIWW